MTKQKVLALVAMLGLGTMGLAGSGTALADGHWRSRPDHAPQPRVQIGVNISLGGYGYAPGVPVPMVPVVQQWSRQPVVVWAPGYRMVYTPTYGGGYQPGYWPGTRRGYQPGYPGGNRGYDRHDHRNHRHHGGDRCDD